MKNELSVYFRLFAEGTMILVTFFLCCIYIYFFPANIHHSGFFIFIFFSLVCLLVLSSDGLSSLVC